MNNTNSIFPENYDFSDNSPIPTQEKPKHSFLIPFIIFLVLSVVFGGALTYIYTRDAQTIATLQTEKTEIEDKLNELEKAKTQALESPFVLLPGAYSIPDDLPPGKYKVSKLVAGNFNVYNKDGKTRVSIRFGFDLSQYICTLRTGDFIRSTAELQYELIE